MLRSPSDRPYRRSRRFWYLHAYKQAMVRVLGVLLLTFAFSVHMIGHIIRNTIPSMEELPPRPPATLLRMLREERRELTSQLYLSFGLDQTVPWWENLLVYTLDRLAYEPILIFVVAGGSLVLFAEAYQRVGGPRYE